MKREPQRYKGHKDFPAIKISVLETGLEEREAPGSAGGSPACAAKPTTQLGTACGRAARAPRRFAFLAQDFLQQEDFLFFFVPLWF